MAKIKNKEQVSDSKIVESLLELKKELMSEPDYKSREIVFKINSCLFSEYPHNFSKENIR